MIKMMTMMFLSIGLCQLLVTLDSLVVRTMSTALSTCIWVDRIMCVSITRDRDLRLMPNSHRRRRRDETHQCKWGINSPAGSRVRRCLGGRTRLVRKLEPGLLWICCTTSCRILWNVADLFWTAVRSVVDFLYASICCTTSRHYRDIVDLLRVRCTASCTTNPRLIEREEFGLCPLLYCSRPI